MTRGTLLAASCALLTALVGRPGHAEESALSKACIFAVAAQLPLVPGLTIKKAETTAASSIPVGAADPTLRQWNVTIDIDAAGQSATYDAACSVGAKTPASVLKMNIRQ